MRHRERIDRQGTMFDINEKYLVGIKHAQAARFANSVRTNEQDMGATWLAEALFGADDLGHVCHL